MTRVYDPLAGCTLLFQILRDSAPDACVELRAISTSGRVEQEWIAQLGDEAGHVNRWLMRDLNVYVGIATRRQGGGKKSDLISTALLWCEIDFKGLAGGEGEARTNLARYPRRPSLVIRSGGGFHSYWRIAAVDLTEEAGQRRFEAVLTQLIADIGGDPACKDSTRILRLPGTFNFKPQYGDPRPVVIVEDIETADAAMLYTLDQFPLPPRREPRPALPLPHRTTHTYRQGPFLFAAQSKSSCGRRPDTRTNPLTRL